MQCHTLANQICCSELKTQNAFVPKEENLIEFEHENGGLWSAGPSHAVCQLEDVEAILGGQQTNIYYTMEIKGPGIEVNAIDCIVTLTPSKNVDERKVQINNADVRQASLDTGELTCSTGNVKVTYTYESNTNEGGILTMKVPLTENTPSANCKFIEHDRSDSDNQPKIIDEQYLTTREIRLSIEGTSVSKRNETAYQIMKDEFVCAVQGSLFESAEISCGDLQKNPADGRKLQATCQKILTDTGTASCVFDISKNLLQPIKFRAWRSNIAYHVCELGSELDKSNGVCNLCPEGKYRDDTEMKGCENCPDLKYAPNPGSTNCVECKNGFVHSEGKKCTACLPGQHVTGNGDKRRCTNCPAGEKEIVINGTGTGACTKCERNKYSLPGSTECQYCKAGYEIMSNQTGCSPCGLGYFKSDEETDTCTACDEGKTTNYYGQTSCDVVEETEKVKYCGIKKEDTAAGDITFYPVQAGQKATSPCPNNGESFAVRQCNSNAEWEEPDIAECNSKKTETIKKIEVKTEESLNSLKEETKVTKDIAPKDIDIVVSKMKGDEVKHVFNSSTNTSIRYLAEKSMAVMSNMMVASQSSPINQKSKNEIVDSMEHVALLALEHLKNDDETLDISTDASDIILVKEAATSTSPIGNDEISINLNQSSNIQNLAALIYKDTQAFKPPSNKSRANTRIVGKVVGLKHTKREGDKTDDSISFKMRFNFSDLNNPEKKPRQKVLKECHFYQPESDSWSTAGCISTVKGDGSVECECNHMTSFAVLLSVEENKVPMWLSNLVLGINVTFCILTLLCTLPFRTFRVRKMTIIQSHSILSLCLLCVTWFLMQDIELSESAPAYENAGCRAVAFIAHYFLMATFSWIFCCSLTLKSQIVDAVKSFGKKNKNLVKKCVLFGYGFPLVIPLLAFLMDFLMQEYSTEGPEGQQIHYIRELECWYEDIWIYSFILFPIYIFFIINVVCFIKIMRVIGNARRSGDGSSERKVVKAGFTLAFTQGLPWILQPGVLTDGGAEVFQYLFLISFGLQGIGLFVFNVLFQEEVLKNLCGLLNVKPPLIFLSVVPSKQRRTPNSQTGETSLGTARNSSGNTDKLYSNNLATYYEDESVCMEDSECDCSTGTTRSKVEHINFRSTLNSVATAAVGEKSLYQDSSYYNELHESSVVTEHRSDETYSHLNKTRTNTRELGGSNTDLLEKPLPSPRVVNFVAGIRTYNDYDGHRSPIPGETEKSDHQGPPFV